MEQKNGVDLTGQDYDGYPYLSPVFEDIDPVEVTNIPWWWKLRFSRCWEWFLEFLFRSMR